MWPGPAAADRVNILKQKVLSYWLCLSITWKIKEEASQKNQEDEAGRGGHRAVGVK